MGFIIRDLKKEKFSSLFILQQVIHVQKEVLFLKISSLGPVLRNVLFYRPIKRKNQSLFATRPLRVNIIMFESLFLCFEHVPP